MYSTSTFFIKAQVPSLTREELLLLYRDELENENETNVVHHEGIVSFSHEGWRSTFNGPYGQFFFFRRGEIRITETPTEYIVNFVAKGKIFFILMPFIIIIGLALLQLTHSGTIFIVLGIAIALFFTIARKLHMIFSFPVYFVRLRNRIEQHVTTGY
ncbi:MAG: hypothetical protein JST39_18515 [Bacteroidetes bacterium]|nr:hypothetical protein [Bacteroidota bacterium]